VPVPKKDKLGGLRQEGHPAIKMGVGAPLVRMGWRPPGLSVPLPPLSSPAPQNPENFHDGVQSLECNIMQNLYICCVLNSQNVIRKSYACRFTHNVTCDTSSPGHSGMLHQQVLFATEMFNPQLELFTLTDGVSINKISTPNPQLTEKLDELCTKQWSGP